WLSLMYSLLSSLLFFYFFFFSSRRRHTRSKRDWSSDVCSSDLDHSAEVDDLIRAHLRGWTMERIPRVSITVLRLAIAEMLYGAEHKPSVAINEAVELAKKYGAE